MANCKAIIELELSWLGGWDSNGMGEPALNGFQSADSVRESSSAADASVKRGCLKT